MASDTVQPDPDPSRAEPAVDSEQFRKFIFTRELAEVYLLLDNVSTSSTKTLPGEPNGGGGEGLITSICKIAGRRREPLLSKQRTWRL